MPIIVRSFLFILVGSIIFSQGFFDKEFPTPKIEYNPKTYLCFKTDELILIDGKIDETTWDSAPWTDLFVDIEGFIFI